jgi:hypothetical protein
MRSSRTLAVAIIACVGGVSGASSMGTKEVDAPLHSAASAQLTRCAVEGLQRLAPNDPLLRTGLARP